MSQTQHPPAPAPAPAAPKADPAAVKAAKEAQAAGSIGAQVILDFNSQAGLGARGGAAPTMLENVALRDENLIALGLDPLAPSGPPLTPEEVAAKRKREEETAKLAAEPRHVTSQATKLSSLAAGIQDPPTPPPARAAHG